jgi:pyruvate dehydrogenase E2 component (dihydrolipoamide acetyltransferase)
MASRDAIVMPKLGLTMTEGVVASWRVAPGDHVKTGDVLFVVETEKVANEVVAESDGEIALLLIGEGETAPVGATIAKWAPRAASAAKGSRIVATPYARKRARLRGLSIRDVVGTGPKGRVKACDVDAVSIPTSVEAAPRPESVVPSSLPSEATSTRRFIAQFHVLAEPDISSLLAFRDKANREVGAPRLAILHFVVAAVARTLRDMPETNRFWQDDAIVSPDGADVSVAIDSDSGVFTQILADADKRGLRALALGLDDPARRAGMRTRAAVAVSGIGIHGASRILPNIGPGPSAVLGVGAARPTFRPDARGAPELRQELNLALACDPRVWDGARAARFLNAIASFLEQPLLLLT